MAIPYYKFDINFSFNFERLSFIHTNEANALAPRDRIYDVSKNFVVVEKNFCTTK